MVVHLHVVADVDVDVDVIVDVERAVVLDDAIAVDVVGDFLYINRTATATTVVNALGVPEGRS